MTEYGIADLRGKSDRDVIAAMLAIADSRFQDELLRRAKDAGKIAREFELPAACRDNTPERIVRALAPARAQGLLPVFPFGTDFTATEQRLIPALRLLASASPLRLARLALRGLSSGTPPAELRECLARMGLETLGRRSISSTRHCCAARSPRPMIRSPCPRIAPSRRRRDGSIRAKPYPA